MRHTLNFKKTSDFIELIRRYYEIIGHHQMLNLDDTESTEANESGGIILPGFNNQAGIRNITLSLQILGDMTVYAPDHSRSD